MLSRLMNKPMTIYRCKHIFMRCMACPAGYCDQEKGDRCGYFVVDRERWKLAEPFRDIFPDRFKNVPMGLCHRCREKKNFSPAFTNADEAFEYLEKK